MTSTISHSLYTGKKTDKHTSTVTKLCCTQRGKTHLCGLKKGRVEWVCMGLMKDCV